MNWRMMIKRYYRQECSFTPIFRLNSIFCRVCCAYETIVSTLYRIFRGFAMSEITINLNAGYEKISPTMSLA